MVYSTRRFVVCLSVCHFVLVFSVLLVLRLPRLGKRELILVLFVRLFGLCLFRFVGFLFLLGSGKGCGLWLWHSLDFSLTFLHVQQRCWYHFRAVSYFIVSAICWWWEGFFSFCGIQVITENFQQTFEIIRKNFHAAVMLSLFFNVIP